MWYGFICGSAIIIWNNSALFPRITYQPTWNQHTQSDSDHRCHIPAFTSHGQTHQLSPRHSWSCLTEIDLFCYGPVNPLRKAAIINARLHMGDSNPNVKLTNTSVPREIFQTTWLSGCVRPNSAGTISIMPSLCSVTCPCFLVDVCCATAAKTTV